MNKIAFPQESDTLRKALCYLFFILAPAYLTTRYSLPLFSGIEYIFGSFFIILAFHFFGFISGIFTALIVCLTTAVVWGHPYAIPAFFGEAVAFGLLRHRTPSPLFIAMPYWLFIGIPTVYFLFHFGVGLESTASFTVALKQSCNAFLNSATAGLFIIIFENVIRRNFKRKSIATLIPLHHLALLTTAFILSVILLLAIAINSRIEMQRNITELYGTAQNICSDIELTLLRWKDTNLGSVIRLAQQTQSAELTTPSTQTLERVKNFSLSRGLEINSMYIGDASGTTIAAYPTETADGTPTIGLNYSDRPYFKKMKETQLPVVSDIFLGRDITNLPVIGFIAPITIGNQFAGFSFAGARLEFLEAYITQLAKKSESSLFITTKNDINVINSDNQAALSTYHSRVDLQPHQITHASITQHIQIPSQNPIEANQLAFFVIRGEIPSFNWNVIIEKNGQSIIDRINQSNLVFLAIAFVLFYMAVPILLLSFKAICAPLSTLNKAFTDLSTKGFLPPSQAPQSTIREYQDLFQTLLKSSYILDVNRTTNQKLIRKLTASESSLAVALDSIRDGVITTDSRGRITRLNPTAEKFIGWNQKEVEGKPIEEFFRIIDINSRKLVSSAITEVLSQLSTPRADRQAILLDREGNEHYIVENASELREEDRTLLGAMLTFRDISSKYHYQKKIEELHSKFSTIIENTSEGILLLDASLRVQFANKKMSELFDHDIKENSPCYKSICQENSCQHCQALQAIQQKIVTSSKREFIKGKIHRIIATPILDSAGEVVGVVELAIDITGLEQSLNELQKSEQRFREFFKNNGFPCAICMPVVNGDGHMTSFTLIDVNPAYGLAVNKKRETLIGIDIRDLFPDMPEDIFQRYIKVATTGIADHFFEKHKKTGSTYYCSVFKSAQDDLQFYLTFEDATEREKLEFQLFHSQKMDALGQLAGGVAHDFNNLLCAMVGYSELIAAMASDRPVIANYANQITTTGKRATELTQKLLSFARKGKRSSEIFDIHGTIHEVSRLLERSIDKSIVIEVTQNAATTKIYGDQSQIHNALLNLGLNARDAMQHGGVFSITTENIAIDREYCQTSNFDITPGNYIAIEAKDTGSGIAEETLDHIFEPFFTTKEIGKGTGLGLAAIFGAITAHAGEIIVTSILGKGTVFRVLLPLANLTMPRQTVIPLTTHHITRGSGTILVIDDEEVIRNMAKELLNSLGYLVILAKNGQEGVTVYEKRHNEIDAVILDVVMPIMSGRDCFNALKLINPEIKTIISSGFSRNDRIDEFKQAGADYFLAKPYDQKALAEALHKLLYTCKIALNAK